MRGVLGDPQVGLYGSFARVLPGGESGTAGNQLWDVLVEMELHCQAGRWDPEAGALPAVRGGLAAGGSAAPCYTASYIAQAGSRTVCSLSQPLGNDCSSRNLRSAKHRQLFPRASEGQ